MLRGPKSQRSPIPVLTGLDVEQPWIYRRRVFQKRAGGGAGRTAGVQSDAASHPAHDAHLGETEPTWQRRQAAAAAAAAAEDDHTR